MMNNAAKQSITISQLNQICDKMAQNLYLNEGWWTRCVCMSVPSPEQQINRAQENHRITSQQFQSILKWQIILWFYQWLARKLLIPNESLLIKKTNSQNVSLRRIVLYIGVIPWQKVFSKCRQRTTTSQKTIPQK